MSLLLLAETAGFAQAGLEEFKPYNEHPRLFLTARRLRLLRKETERNSIRWEIWKKSLERPAGITEPGFVGALYYQVTGQEDAGQKAVAWAASPKASDMRQLALVFDWCQPLLSAAASRELTTQLKADLDRPLKGMRIDEVRDQVLAAVALAGHVPLAPERRLKQIVTEWWPAVVDKPILAGHNPFTRRDLYAVFEILHAVRDNLQIDLREKAPGYFKDLPVYYVAGHYPAPFPSNVGLFRIPAEKGLGQPEQRAAELSRMAGLAMVAYDGNAQEAQFAQGWLIDDRYLLQTGFGAPYEFLWANPYLPGLPFDRLPLVFYEPVFGDLYIRSNWLEEGEWLGYFDGEEVQVMKDGNFSTRTLTRDDPPVEVGTSILTLGSIPLRMNRPENDASRLFLLGMPKNQPIDLEIEDQELLERKTDENGILDLKVFPGTPLRLRLHPVGEPPAPAGS